MLSTLAVAAVLSLAPSQSDTLQLKNVRATFGPLGQERKDSKVLGGDAYFVSFDIEGLKVRDDGQVKYSMSMDLTNKEGKSQYKQEPQELEAFNALGGSRVPAFAHILIGTDTPEGEYTLKVTVKDRATEKSDTLTRKFEVLPRKFGLVQINMSYQAPAQNVFLPAPPLGVPGQTFLVNFAVVGFDLDKSRKDQPNIETSMRVLDEDGKPTLAKPYSGEAKEVDAQFKRVIPMQFFLQLNRPGKFKIEVKATDKVGGKTAEQILDLTVVEINK
jgi:hypothetical protein